MKKEEARISSLFDLEHTIAKALFERHEYPWEVLDDIGEFIMELGPTLPADEYLNAAEGVWIHKSVRMYETASVAGPAIIDEGTEIRPSAFIRGSVIIGRSCVIGNACEYKNCILFDEVQTPHYNYIGDSVLGYRSHTGAASLTSNIRNDKQPVRIHFEDGDVQTGRIKVGAMAGDYVEVGCGAVLNPGTVLGRNTDTYPLCCVRGTVSESHIVKNNGEVVAKHG